MDALLLSRIQFGLSVGIHFLFPVSTLGLAFFIVLAEGFYLKTAKEVYRHVSALAVKVLGLIFAMGVATGIIMPFAFGTNWGNFVNFASSVFGIHLTIEAIVAFLLESVFLGVLMFGRKRVGPKLYFVAAFLVFFGSHLSGFIIISANSWMQTPFHSLATLSSGVPLAAVDGFHLDKLADGSYKVVMDDVLKVIFNPSTGIRFVHTVAACWLCGAVIMAAVAGWFHLKHKQTEVSRKTFSIAAVVGLVTALAMPVLGHTHIMNVLEWQPTKNAAMEGIFKTQEGAPLYALAVVDTEKRETSGFGLPYMLSFFEGFRFDTKVAGLDDVLAEGQAGQAQNPPVDAYKAYAPPVQTIFQTFRVMIFMGVFMIVGMLLGVYFVWRKQWRHKWLWRVALVMVPMPYLAVETGWITAEIGRQPWIVYGLLKTKDAVSAIPGEYVAFSLAIFVLVYCSLGFLLAKWLPRIIKEGLEEHAASSPELAVEAAPAKAGK